MWWEVIGLPLMAAAVAAGLAVFRVTRWATLRAVGTWTGIVLGSLRWPATIAAVSAVLALATRAFTLSGPIDAVIAPLVVLGFATAVVLFAMQALDAALERIVTFEAAELSSPGEAERRTWATAVSAIRRVILLLVVLVGAGIALSSAGVFQTFGFSLLASAGALTLVVGFAARTVLGNILASLQITLSRSAKIGDRITYDGHWCKVERIHFTTVQLKV